MSESPPEPVKKRHHIFPYSIALILLFALGVVSGVLWLEIKERFPKLPVGTYVGSIQGIALDDSVRVASLYLESKDDGQNFDVLVLAPGFSLNQIKPSVRGEDKQSADWLFPITIEGTDLNLKFMGEKLGPDSYGGKVVEINSSAQGEWELSRSAQSSNELANEKSSELALWLMLKSELNLVEERIAKAEAVVPKQKQEIESLRKFVTEGVSLKTKGEQRYNQERAKFKEAVEVLKAKQQEARELESRIELSQRLTPMGKLVALARESLDREGRWLESMLRSAAVENKPSLDSAYQRGQDILSLKSAIAAEQQRISNLQVAPADQGQIEQNAGMRVR